MINGQYLTTGQLLITQNDQLLMNVQHSNTGQLLTNGQHKNTGQLLSIDQLLTQLFTAS